MESYWISTLSQPLELAYIQLQTDIKPLLLPFIMNDDISRRMKEAPRMPGLRKRRSPIQSAAALSAKPTVKGVELDDTEIAASGESSAPETLSSTMVAEAVPPAIATVLSLEEDDSRQHDNDQDEGFQEAALSPQQLHEKYQAKKQAERRTSPQPEEVIVHNPEFYAFLRDTVYGTPQFTWEDFSREFNRAGFDIIGAEGNVRRVVLKGTNLKFTVHEPAKVRDPMAYKYVSFIRSGLERVFGLTKEFVTRFKPEVATLNERARSSY